MATKRPYLLRDEAAISTMMTIVSPEDTKKLTPSELSDLEDIRIAFDNSSVKGCDLSISNYDQIKKKLNAVCNKLSKQNDVTTLIKAFLDATTANTNGDIILSTSVTPKQAKELYDKLNDHILNTMYTYLFFLLGDNVYKSTGTHQTGGALVRFYDPLVVQDRRTFIARLRGFYDADPNPRLLEFMNEVINGIDLFDWNRYQSISATIHRALTSAHLDTTLLRNHMRASPGPAQPAASGNQIRNSVIASAFRNKSVRRSIQNFEKLEIGFDQVVILMKERHAALVANPRDNFNAADEYEAMHNFLFDLAVANIERDTFDKPACQRYINKLEGDLKEAQKLLKESRSYMSKAYNMLPATTGTATTILLSGCAVYYGYREIMNPGIIASLGDYFFGSKERITVSIITAATSIVKAYGIGRTITAESRQKLTESDEQILNNRRFEKLVMETEQLRQHIHNRNLDFIQNGLRLGAAAVVLYAGQPTAAAGLLALKRHGLDRLAEFGGVNALPANAVLANPPPPRQQANPQQENESVVRLLRDSAADRGRGRFAQLLSRNPLAEPSVASVASVASAASQSSFGSSSSSSHVSNDEPGAAAFVPGAGPNSRGAGASSSGLVTPGAPRPNRIGKVLGSYTIPNNNSERKGGRRKYSGRKTKHKKRHNKHHTKRHTKRSTRK
jgi:hypothetical protein